MAPRTTLTAGAGLVFVRLRPSLTEATACIAALHDLLRRHEETRVGVAGLARHDHGLYLTVSIPVSLDPASIARAHRVSDDMFVALLPYDPHYTSEPSEPEAKAVKRLPSKVSATSASIPVQAWLDAAHPTER